MGISRISEFWPGWSVTDVLGEGAYGKVFKAVKSEGGFETFAAIKLITVPASNAELKALRAEGFSEDESKTYFKGIVTDFINEIKLMENLKGAPNIVSVEDYKILERTDSIGWNIYIRMELLQPFDDYMSKNKLSEKDIIRIGIDLCKGLEICCKYHIIHRDIKPANIFVSKFGDFKLGDFGIAKELEKTSSAMSSKGTYSYMAPEVAHGLHYDSTVDIYSLGIVLYTLLNNNRQPFLDPNSTQISYNDRKNAADRRLSGEVIPPPCNASKDLASVILCACSYSGAHRFKTPTAFKNALIACMEGKPVAQEVVEPANKGFNNEIWNTPSLMSPPVKKAQSVSVPSSDRMKELYPAKKKSSGKRFGKILAVVTAIAVIAAFALIFVPTLFGDNKDVSHDGASLDSQIMSISPSVGELRVDITESQRSPLGSVVPGEEIKVDPYVNVYSGSGDCWLFVELYMTEDFEYIFEYSVSSEWTRLDGYDNVYYIEVDNSEDDQSFGVFEYDCIRVPNDMSNNVLDRSNNISLNYSAFALPYDQANSAETAWKKIISSQGYTGE